MQRLILGREKPVSLPPRQILSVYTYYERANKLKKPRTALWRKRDIPPEFEASGIDYVSTRVGQYCEEAGNLSLYEMRPDNTPQAFRDMKSMCSGGFLVVFVTFGRFVRGQEDEESLLDQKLKTDIEQFVEIKTETSEAWTAAQTTLFREHETRLEEALPIPPFLKNPERSFFDLIEDVKGAPLSNRIELGLALPEHKDRLHWVYLVKMEDTLRSFHLALAENLGALAPECPIAHHMKGYQWATPLKVPSPYRQGSPELRLQ